MNDPVHVVCTACNAANRIPTARLGDSPKCGKCHRPLFGAHAESLSEAAFERQLARSDIPVLVDFWADRPAPWAPPTLCTGPSRTCRRDRRDTDQATPAGTHPNSKFSAMCSRTSRWCRKYFLKPPL